MLFSSIIFQWPLFSYSSSTSVFSDFSVSFIFLTPCTVVYYVMPKSRNGRHVEVQWSEPYEQFGNNSATNIFTDKYSKFESWKLHFTGDQYLKVLTFLSSSHFVIWWKYIYCCTRLKTLEFNIDYNFYYILLFINTY